MARPLKMLQRLRPLPSHLVRLPENSLDPGVIAVYGRQLSGL